MAIASEGGSGSTTVTITAQSVQSTTVFTTPNSTDYIYKVEVGGGSEGFITAQSFSSAGGGETGGQDISVNGLGIVTVGPNTPVVVMIGNSGTSNEDITINYQYVGVKVS